MRLDFLPVEDGVSSAVNRRVLVRVRLPVVVQLHLDVAEECLRHEGKKVRLWPLVAGLALPFTMEEAHELSYLIVVELHLPFLSEGRAGASDGDSSSASYLSIVMLGVVYV